MNIEDVWSSPRNSPTAIETETLIAGTRDTLRRIQRRRTSFVVRTGVALAGVTGVAGYVGATRPLEMFGAWPLLLILIAQWVVFATFAREMLGGRPGADVQGSVRESIERLWREAENSRRGQLLMLTLFAVVAPLLGLAIAHLRDAGKMAPHEATSAAVVFAGILATSTIAILVRRYRTVLPRLRRLSALRQQYRAE